VTNTKRARQQAPRADPQTTKPTQRPARQQPPRADHGTTKRARELARQQAELVAKQQRERRIFVVLSIAVVLLLIGGGIGFQAWRTHRAPVVASTPSATATPIQVSAGRPLLLGPDSAPVKITLYEDFHCPHCAAFEEEFGPTITAAQNKGTAAIELYPMAFIDAGSYAAANAVACAAEAGFGQAYYLGLFANHTLTWNDGQLVALAGKVTTNPGARFNTCVTTDAHKDWVDSINAAADANKVTETPTMFLDSQPVDIATLTPKTLQSMIDKAASS
jgi:protein-disulfide isomerase